MVVTSGQQYNAGKKNPPLLKYCLKKNLNAFGPPVVSHIQRIGCQPEKNDFHGCATQVVSVRLAPAHKDFFDSSARPMGVASQNCTIPCAIASFPVSLPLSLPGVVYPRVPFLSFTRP